MYYQDDKEHKLPHIHAKYQEQEIVLSIADGKVLRGSFPNNKLHLVLAWIEIHRDELLANWELAINGSNVFVIDPLK